MLGFTVTNKVVHYKTWITLLFNWENVLLNLKFKALA